jgi:hypothetical protein
MLQATKASLNTPTAEFKVPFSTNGGTAVATIPTTDDTVALHVRAINYLITRLKEVTDEAEKHVGAHILAIKAAEPNKWEGIVQTRCGISRSRAFELMRIADGTKTVEQTRRETNARQIKYQRKRGVRYITDKKEQAAAKDLAAANAKIITLEAGHQRQIDRFQAEIARLGDAKSISSERDALLAALKEIEVLLSEACGLAKHHEQNRVAIRWKIIKAKDFATSAVKAVTGKSANSAVKVAA